MNPTIPHILAGCLIEPPVSVPRLAGMSHAETAAADHELEPPGIRSFPWGFFVTQKAEFSPEDPIANSSILHFPKLIAPTSFSFFVMVDS